VAALYGPLRERLAPQDERAEARRPLQRPIEKAVQSGLLDRMTTPEPFYTVEVARPVAPVGEAPSDPAGQLSHL
jgi:hypothetical protein